MEENNIIQPEQKEESVEVVNTIINEIDTGKIKKAMEQKHRDFIKMLKQYLGIITPACEALHMSRGTVYLWKNEVEGFAEAIEEVNEHQIDFVENKLMSQIKNDDTTAIIYYLKCKAKHRGYSERQDISMKLSNEDGKPLIVYNLSEVEIDEMLQKKLAQNKGENIVK